MKSIKIKGYFNSETQEKKIMSKKLCKYIAVCDYFEKTLIVLSALSAGLLFLLQVLLGFLKE